VSIAGTTVADRNMAILSNNGASQVCIEAVEDARVLIVAGQPLNEPIAQHGPFVMNTAEQIHQAMRDYQAGKFEAAAVQSL
jgi:redox-sensitive bicupin YhaK (pirin superfamily)